MRFLRYEDFTIALEVAEDDRFITARVVEATHGGGGSIPFELPWRGEELKTLLRVLAAASSSKALYRHARPVIYCFYEDGCLGDFCASWLRDFKDLQGATTQDEHGSFKEEQRRRP